MKWVEYVKEYAKKNGMEFGEAMKKAAPSFKAMKKTGKKLMKTARRGGAESEVEPAEEIMTGGELSASLRGGQLMGKGTVAGGRRSRKHRGGQLYTFAGGPYTGSVLSDGAAPFQPYDLSSMQWEGASPAAMTAGRRRSRKGGKKSRRGRHTRRR